MKKTAIVYGQAESDLQKRTIEELTSIILDYTFEYPTCIQYSADADTSAFRCIYIGTKESNPYIKSASAHSPNAPEGYTISVKNDTVLIEGYDDAGVLYGVLDFYNRYIVKFEHPDTCKYWFNFWEKDTLPDFEYASAPMIKERGLWTWGHVIYDYRDYLRNMMKLKMNAVTIWNDFVPTNALEIVSFAHSCNIKVYWGFSWLWETDFSNMSIGNLAGEPEKILEKYELQYAKAGGDGIYFQTFTEHKTDNLGGVLIASAAADFVNKTVGLLFERYPNLEIQFGLHAISVREKLEFIRLVDPRIKIVWEDCGAFPFSYIPTDIDSFDETKDFVRKIAYLRGEGDRFGAVTKGLVKLDWTRFEHASGSQCIGISSKYMKKNRVERKARIWRYIQAAWIANTDKAAEMVAEMCALKNGDLSVFALVEDGMFEENIMYPVALYSEILWNPSTEIKSLMKEVALRSYVSFA